MVRGTRGSSTSSSQAPKRPGRLRRLGRWLFNAEVSRTRRLVGLTVALAGTGTVLLAGYLLVLALITPGIRNLRQMKVQYPTVVLAADGSELTRFQQRNRVWVGLDEIAPEVIDALIATEDHRFYDHHGVDLRRLAASTVYTLLGDRQGGSTITMQLARNLYPTRIGHAFSLHRKLKEIVTAFKIEATYTKDEILETYLNTVPFLYNAYGIELAARTYFSKSAGDLTLAEAATLVGMLKATSTYNPVRHPERAQQRRNVVLRQMVKRGVLEEAAYERLRDEPIRTRFERQTMPGSRAPHFTQHIRRQLAAWAADGGYNLYTDGLVVHTTLDPRLQALAADAVARQGAALQAVADVEWSGRSNTLRSASPHDYLGLRRQVTPFAYFWEARPDRIDRFIQDTGRYREAVAAGEDPATVLATLHADDAFMTALRAAKTRLEAGFVAIDPRTGHVKAWVGSRSYAEGPFDHVVQARRQPGSTFKPFVYAAALAQGYTPDDRLRDEAVAIRSGDQVWRPVNASGQVSGEEVTLRAALAQSINTVTAQLIEDVGPRRVARLARRMGIRQSPLEAVPSLALGTSEVTLLEMTSAYATIAGGGVYRAPVAITRIEDRSGTVLAEFAPEPERVLEESVNNTLIDMMRGVIDQGTGQRIRHVFGVRADVAGKTGTTQENADGWFLLMHPHLVAGSWVGFNDPRVAFRSDYWGQGGHNALYIVGDVYRHALRQGLLDPRPRLAPEPVIEPRRTFWARAGDWLQGVLDDLAPDDAAPAGPPTAEPAPLPQPAPAPEPEPDRSRIRVSIDGSGVRDEVRRLARDVDIDNVLDVVNGVLELAGTDAETFVQDQMERALESAERALREHQERSGSMIEQAIRDATRDLNDEERAEVERALREFRLQMSDCGLRNGC